MKTKLAYSALATLIIAGGVIGGCSRSEDSVVTSQGIFIDSAVQGLSYKGKVSGITDVSGHYLYQGSGEVEFLLGDKIKVGSLTPKTTIVTPLNFFDGTKDEHDQEVKNILVLLQSLDTDANASNGIEILPGRVSKLEVALEAADFNPATVDFMNLDATLLASILTNAGLTPVLEADAVEHFLQFQYGVQPPIAAVVGSKLACDIENIVTVSDAADFNASQTRKVNVSANGTDDDARINGNGHNTIDSLGQVVAARSANGTLIDGVSVHPIVVSYNEQVVGDYEMGDGSADIGDPAHRDAVFFSMSLDNGETWKKQQVSASEDKTSTQVTWDGSKIDYYGHTQKPTMAVEGNNILVAWNDKYCPSGNPFDLIQDVDGNYSSDVFAVNGSQGSIDYEAIVSPNGKTVYEVPFSCVWTARGFFNPTDGNVTWHSPMQLTTGVRDSNHIWIEGSEAGFALSWQEDTAGLRSGKGEGPGDGWSGATTNRGSDIWYTSIKLDDFDDANITDTKPKSINNFHYPVRITDNEKCSNDDTKPYCKLMCDTYGYVDSNTSNNAGTAITRCLTYDKDMLTDTQVILDGDTGASRSAQKILKTDAGEYIVVFGYEETKGLSESTPGEGDQEQGTVDTNISVEGKSVYFESFPFNAIDAFDENNVSTILTTPMPMVSAGNIINVKVPDRNTSELIYENARRLVIGANVDSCTADRYTFAFMYKQSFETQGASSDMFIRLNNGFKYDTFIDMEGRKVTNVSAQEPIIVDNIVDYNVTWTSANLDDNTYDNMNDNTFSPRIFLRGNNIFTGFEYTPNDVKTSQGNMPSNFHTHIYLDGKGWQGPVNVSKVTKGGATTVDARFFTTPKGSATSTLASDRSNPNVLFVTWGDIDFIGVQGDELGKAESNLWYKRAIITNDGIVWDENATMLSAREGAVIQEKEVESYASPDGKTIYNVWLQEEEPATYDQNDPFSGLDTWFGRVDYNISTTQD